MQKEKIFIMENISPIELLQSTEKDFTKKMEVEYERQTNSKIKIIKSDISYIDTSDVSNEIEETSLLIRIKEWKW